MVVFADPSAAQLTLEKVKREKNDDAKHLKRIQGCV